MATSDGVSDQVSGDTGRAERGGNTAREKLIQLARDAERHYLETKVAP